MIPKFKNRKGCPLRFGNVGWGVGAQQGGLMWVRQEVVWGEGGGGGRGRAWVGGSGGGVGWAGVEWDGVRWGRVG